MMIQKKNYPDPEMIAALVEGKLQGHERKKILEQISKDEALFDIFYDVASFVEQTESPQVVSHPRFYRIIKRPLYLGFSAIAAAILFYFGITAMEKHGWQFWKQEGDWDHHFGQLKAASPFIKAEEVLDTLPMGDWWLDRFGALETNHSLATRAQVVFDRLLQVADIRGETEPRLLLLDHEGDALAFALPDPAVVLSLKGLNYCYDQVDPAVGDHRLAWLLGHELSHLNQGQFAHAFSEHNLTFLDRSSVQKKLAKETANLHQSELHADQSGLVLATLAGFDPQMVFEESNDFLQAWVSHLTAASAYDSLAKHGDSTASSQTIFGASTPSTHPEITARLTALDQQLVQTVQDLGYFQAGTLLLYSGDYELAKPLLETFVKRFPSREAFNNLGMVHTQIAMKLLAQCDGTLAMRFQFPFVVDPHSLAGRAIRRGNNESPCLTQKEFQEAVGNARALFEQAFERDPSYLPAKVNWLALSLMAGKAAEAYERALEWRDQFPEHLGLQHAALLVDYDFGLSLEESGQPLVDQAIHGMVALEADHPDQADLLYNLGTMLNENHQLDRAKQAFASFLENAPHGAYAERVALTYFNQNPEPDSFPPVSVPEELRPAAGLVPIETAGVNLVNLETPQGPLGLARYQNQLTLVDLDHREEPLLVAFRPAVKFTVAEAIGSFGPLRSQWTHHDRRILIFQNIGIEASDHQVQRIWTFSSDQ